MTSSRTNEYGIGLIGGMQCNAPSKALQFNAHCPHTSGPKVYPADPRTPNFLPNRIIHLGLLLKNPFGKPGLRAEFPLIRLVVCGIRRKGAYDLDAGR